ncbi:hypothetical protein Tco_0637329 [Tanacetum coccineum]
MFSIKKTSIVHEKTMTPRSCLKWKPTGKIFKTVGLRWIPTGKIFTSSTTKVDSEPPNGSNKDITNPYECEQTLNVIAGRLLESFQEYVKYEHVGQDTRLQRGKDDQYKQGKDLEISKSKTKSKDNDKGSRSKITQHKGTSLQQNKDQRFKNSTTKQSHSPEKQI